MRFCAASGFQKSIISILAGLKAQQQELERLNDIFIRLDNNKDGVLTKEELRKGLEGVPLLEMFENDQTDGESCSQKLLEACDLDGDGRVDYMEFI